MLKLVQYVRTDENMFADITTNTMAIFRVKSVVDITAADSIARKNV